MMLFSLEFAPSTLVQYIFNINALIELINIRSPYFQFSTHSKFKEIQGNVLFSPLLRNYIGHFTYPFTNFQENYNYMDVSRITEKGN